MPQHRAPTAHMGGVAVALAAYGALAIHSVWGAGGAPGGRLLTTVLAGMAFLALGALDDLLRLSARSKFVAQLLVAALAAAGGVRAPLSGQPLLDGAMATLAIVTVVNAVNLTDVCDGLVAGLMAALLLTAAPAQTSLAPLCLAAGGACLGFLVFNAPPARVFLGDAGSHWLGFLGIAAALSATPTRPALDLARLLLWCGVFLFELALLVLARTARGIPFWLGSPDHFSLRLQAAGLPRWPTVLVAWAAGAALGLLAWRLPALAAPWSAILPGAAFLAGAVLLATLWLTTGPSRPRPAADEPRRLLWFHQNFVSGRQAGNARAMHLISALLERGWVVDVVTTQASYLEERDASGGAPVIEREGRLTIHRLPQRGGPGRRAASWVSFCARSLLYAGRFRRVDVLYASTPPLPQTIVAAVVAWARRAPLVLEVRDLWPLFLERLGLLRSPLALRAAEWMEAFADRSARRVIAASPAFAVYLAEMGVRPERTTVAPTGIESIAGVGEEERSRVRSERGWEGRCVVFYAGSFNESYEIGGLLRAAERTAAANPRVLWVLAGGGRARREVEAAQRRDHLVYLGLLERDRLWPLLQAADVGLVSLGPNPVLQLVIPGKLFDYAAAGLPIVSTTSGMAGAIVRAAGAGRIAREPSDEALAEEILAMASLSEDERRRIGSAGRAWLLAHMSSAESARTIALAVEQVAREEAGRSQAAHLLLAGAGAFADVLRRRSSRAATRLLVPALSSRCEDELGAWLARKDGASGVPTAPLRAPVLLTALGSHPGE